ncbi:MAG: methylmalonyl Co-A mutase-associated GTPase MeaB [Candidatus Krumholzibacteriia bacterium]
MTRPPNDPEALVARLGAGDNLACARAITCVEALDARSDALLALLYPRLGRAWRVGLAGPPGAGKSTLALRLARIWRDRGWRVGIIAVDPTSPLSGGALLGDRIRLRDVATDPGVFIRSLATRGSLGGLSLAAGRVADVLDAWGADVVLFETVGMGQVGEDVRLEADSTAVVLVPESGDGVQAMKAGLLELADVLVVNKADRPGATDLVRQLAARGGRAPGLPGPGATAAEPAAAWDPPVVATCAVDGSGTAELAEALDRHRAVAAAVGRRARDGDAFWRERFTRLAEAAVVRELRAALAADPALAARLAAVRRGERPLGGLLAEVLARFRGGAGAPTG